MVGVCLVLAQSDSAPAIESADVLNARTEKINYGAYFALNNTTGLSGLRPGFLLSSDMGAAGTIAPSDAALLAYGLSGVLQLYEANGDPALLQQGRDVFSGLMEALSGHTNTLATTAYDDVLPALTLSALILKDVDALRAEHLRQLQAIGEQWQSNTLGRLRADAPLPDPVFDLRTPQGAHHLETATHLGLLFESEEGFAVSRTRANHQFRYLLEQGDIGLSEEPDASAALCVLINIGRRLNRQGDLAALEPMFKRLHAETLPNASLPHRLRPYQLRWTYALETAAKLLNQPDYAYSAQKHFLAFHSYHNMYPELSSSTPIHVGARETHLCTRLAALSPGLTDGALEAMTDLSAITFEHPPDDKANYASLVLRTGHAPEQAALSLSFLAGPGDQRSALQMLTFDGVTLHEPAPPGASLGSEATQLWMQPAGIPFPFRQRDAEAMPSPDESAISAAYAAAGFTWRKASDTGQLERHYTLSGIEADRIGRDVSARLSFQRYGTPGSSLVRRLILTQEGYLFITDLLTPGEDAQTFAAGQLWRIPEKTSWVRNGGNWLAYIFDQPEPILDQTEEPATLGALIHFGSDRDDLYVGQSDDILYSKRNLTQETTTFAMVCLPLTQGQPSPHALARQVSIRISGERAGVTLPNGTRITSSPGKWTVTRPEPSS